MVAKVKAVVFLCLWLCTCQVRGSNIPLKMNRTIQNLLQIYKIPNSKRFDGKPVFSRELLVGQVEDKKLFLSGVLETCEKILDNMLAQLPTSSPTVDEKKPAVAVTSNLDGTKKESDVRSSLTYILNRIQELRKHYYKEQDMLLQGIRNLKYIQMDNTVIQSKFLWELPWLYEMASSLGHIKLGQRRKRRQTLKMKLKPRS